MRATIKNLLVAGGVLAGCLVTGCTIPVEATTTTKAPAAEESSGGMSDAEVERISFQIAWDQHAAEICANQNELVANGISLNILIEMGVQSFLEGAPNSSDEVLDMLRDELRNC